MTDLLMAMSLVPSTEINSERSMALQKENSRDAAMEIRKVHLTETPLVLH